MVKAKGTRKRKPDKVLSHPAFRLLVALNIIGAIVAAWIYIKQNDGPQPYSEEYISTTTEYAVENPVTSTANISDTATDKKPVSAPPADPVSTADQPAKETGDAATSTTRVKNDENTASQAKTQNVVYQTINRESNLGTYTVTKPKVYFHNAPDEKTRRKAFINHWNKAVLKPLDDVNGFVYIEYTNPWGQTSKGWMLKSELTPVKR